MNLTQIGIGAFLTIALFGSIFWTALALELLTKTCGG
jgi:hypothetical protein